LLQYLVWGFFAGNAEIWVILLLISTRRWRVDTAFPRWRVGTRVLHPIFQYYPSPYTFLPKKNWPLISSSPKRNH